MADQVTTKLLTLIDPNTPVPLRVGGVSFMVKPLSIGDKRKILSDIRSLPTDESSFDKILDIMDSLIVAVIGYDGETPREFLSNRLAYFNDLMRILNAVLSMNALSEDEAKNSAGSPSGIAAPTASSAGSSEPVAVTAPGGTALPNLT